MGWARLKEARSPSQSGPYATGLCYHRPPRPIGLGGVGDAPVAGAATSSVGSSSFSARHYASALRPPCGSDQRAVMPQSVRAAGRRFYLVDRAMSSGSRNRGATIHSSYAVVPAPTLARAFGEVVLHRRVGQRRAGGRPCPTRRPSQNNGGRQEGRSKRTIASRGRRAVPGADFGPIRYREARRPTMPAGPASAPAPGSSSTGRGRAARRRSPSPGGRRPPPPSR